jgi:hypothetical protein
VRVRWGCRTFGRRANNFDTARQARTAKPPKLRLAVTVPCLHDGPLPTTTSAKPSRCTPPSSSPPRLPPGTHYTPAQLRTSQTPRHSLYRRLPRRHALRNGPELGEVPEELRRRRGRGEEDHASHRRVSLPACPGHERSLSCNRDIQVLKTYGAAPYGAELRKLEKEIKDKQSAINDKIGVKVAQPRLRCVRRQLTRPRNQTPASHHHISGTSPPTGNECPKSSPFRSRDAPR